MAKEMNRRYKSTESKYKGGAKEMYITYDLKQPTRGGEQAIHTKPSKLPKKYQSALQNVR